MSSPTERVPEWSLDSDAGAEKRAAAERQAAKAAAERRRAYRDLGLAALAAGLVGAVVAALIVINPAVGASVESRVPTGTIELVGNVTSTPALSKLGVLELGWNPFGPAQAHPIQGQSILLTMSLSSTGCKRLAQIGGVCGAGPVPSLRDLESLRLAAGEESLHVSVTAPSAPRSELEPIGKRPGAGLRSNGVCGTTRDRSGSGSRAKRRSRSKSPPCRSGRAPRSAAAPRPAVPAVSATAFGSSTPGPPSPTSASTGSCSSTPARRAGKEP